MDNITKSTVLVVDDTEENVNILVEVLDSEYEVSVALNGESALEIVELNPPDIILLDIMMPEMDGYEVCERLKGNEKTRDIPVIFVTTMSEEEDESNGFEIGAVDYITKPISPSVVKARVKTHLELRRTQKNFQKLLEETLTGSISVLTELLSLTNPLAFNLASKIKLHVQHIVNELKLPGAWQFELSAMLSQIGCVMLPPAILNRIYRGASVTVEESAMFNAHPLIGSKLLARIPRLEDIAKIISNQNKHVHCSPDKELCKRDPITLGSQILKLVIDYEREKSFGTTPKKVLEKMNQKQNLYDPALLSIFAMTIQARNVNKLITVKDLECNMTIDEDIFSSSGEVIMTKGTEVTLPIINFLRNYSLNTKIKQPFRILVSV